MLGNHVRVHSYPQIRQQAQQLADGGDLPGARAMLAQAVDLGRPALATADPELLATMRQLAGLHMQEADPAGARRLLEEAYAAGQRTDPAGPLMVLLAYDLAVVAEELANRHEARRNFALVATHGPAALGEGHPALSHARDYLSDNAVSPPGNTSLPLPGSPGSRAPVSGLPVPGAVPLAPVSGASAPLAPVSGLSAQLAPVSGPSAQLAPVSGSSAPLVPVSGASAPVPASFGGVGGARRSRTPWVVAAAAVVFALAMLVVVLVRPGAEPGPGAPVAGAASAPAAPPAASALGTTEPATAPTTAPTTAPATTGPAPKAPAATKRTQAVPSAPPTTRAVASRIVTPKNGSDVGRQFTVTFTVSAADVAASGTRLALTVCVSVWCFLDGPVVIENGAAKDYTVTLGTGEGEGVGEKWTVRVDRLSRSTYADLQAQKQAAVDDGTWGDGVTTPKDRLNKTPVSAVVVTKTS